MAGLGQIPLPSEEQVTADEVERDMRRLGGLSRTEFAELMGVERSTVSHWASQTHPSKPDKPRQYRWAILGVIAAMADLSGHDLRQMLESLSALADARGGPVG